MKIRLTTPRSQYNAPAITHARVTLGAYGYELWGDTGNGGEIHLDTICAYEYHARPEAITNWIDKHGEITSL